MKITTPKLIRWAGLSAVVAGIIFTAIQPTHPSINSSTFIIITSFKTSISIFGLLGITGLYARQVEETGWLGLAGYLLLTIYYAVQMCISFIEPTILPLLTTSSANVCRKRIAVVKWGWWSQRTLAASQQCIRSYRYCMSSAPCYLALLCFALASYRAGRLPCSLYQVLWRAPCLHCFHISSSS